MYSQVCQNYGNICELVGIKNSDTSYSVGVVDSVLSPSDETAEEFHVRREVDLIGKPEIEDTSGHGKGVVSILYGTSSNMELFLYRAVQESGLILQRDLLRAIYEASVEDNIDVLNLSLGFDHGQDGVSCSDQDEPCKTREAVLQAIDMGTTIVAASGNADPSSPEDPQDSTVCCPACVRQVISVGGFAALCTYTLPRSGPDQLHRPTSGYPPLAGWIQSTEVESEGTPLCTGLGCVPMGTSCNENRIIVEWEGNVGDDNAKIDILAPVAYPIVSQGNLPSITRGTSYAAPFVSSAVGTIIALLREDGKSISPAQLRKAIMDSGKPVDEGDGEYLRIQEAIVIVDERFGVPGGFTSPSDTIDIIDLDERR